MKIRLKYIAIVIGIILTLAIGISIGKHTTTQYYAAPEGTVFVMPLCIDESCDVYYVNLTFDDNNLAALPQVNVNTTGKYFEVVPAPVGEIILNKTGVKYE